jgi:hypothetical protein
LLVLLLPALLGCAALDVEPEDPSSHGFAAPPQPMAPGPIVVVSQGPGSSVQIGDCAPSPAPRAALVGGSADYDHFEQEAWSYGIPRARSRSLGFIGDDPLTGGVGRGCGCSHGRCDNLEPRVRQDNMIAPHAHSRSRLHR